MGIYNVNTKSRIKEIEIGVGDFDIDSSGTYIIASSSNTISFTSNIVMLHRNDFFSSVFDIPEDNDNYFRLYPNPTKDFANLELGSSKGDFYNLGIYDYLGNQMENLFSGFLDAGEHRFTWYPNNCMNGTYFCRIDNGKKVKVIKLIYIK
jgi:hypothetical protein